jgi:flagellar hook-associated protein 1 FlgK
MAGLFSSLNTASTALDVFSRALGSDQLNVANASTPGYAAQRAVILPIDLNGDGAGRADYIALSSNSSSVADAVVQAASSQAAASQTRVQQLTPINQLFDIAGQSGILAALQQFSDAFSTVAVTPNDATLRANALTAAGNVATAFQKVAATLDTQKVQVDQQLQTTVTQINDLAKNIRQVNIRTIAAGQISPADDASLRSDLDQLSTLVDVTVTKNGDGSVSVLAGGQLPLVAGTQAYALSADPSGSPGAQIQSTGGGGSPASFSGQLGALLETRNTTIGQLLGVNGDAGALNTLAAGFASRVNSLLASGVTASGAQGAPIFSFDAVDPTNTARTLSLDPSITPDQLALATSGASGSANGIANALASLPASNNSSDQISGLSVEDLYSSIAASAGQQLADARNASASDQTTLTSAQTSRQQQIGVSLDQEAVNITQFQRAYEANARVVSILNQLTDDEVNLLR